MLIMTKNETPMKNVMVDLETLGTVPGCAILSIGAVFFDVESGLGAQFYTPVHRESCKKLKLWEDPDTIAWWERQNHKAKRLLKEVEKDTTPHLKDALKRLDEFIKQETSVKVWGNGADFDNPILAVAHHKAKLKQCWGAWNGRCYRTLKNIAPGPKLERVGTYHHALDDAKSQALHAIELFKLHPTLVLG